MMEVAPTAGTWFGTEFDEPVVPLHLPGAVRGGGDPALRLTDHVVRGRRIVGRVGAAQAMVGVKVRAAGRPVRVTVELHLDAEAVRWWARRADREAVAAAGPVELPRLVTISAQGRIRRAVLLARARVGARPVDVWSVVSFELAADELPDAGLLTIEVLDVAPDLPDWAAAASTPAAPVGLRVDSIEVVPAGQAEGGRSERRWDAGAAERLGLVSSGGLIGGPARRDRGPARTPALVVNPPPAATAVRCRVRPLRRWAWTVRPPATTAWSESAVGGAFGRLMLALEHRRAGRPLRGRAVVTEMLAVRALSLPDCRELPVRVAVAGPNLDLTVSPAPSGPFLLHVAPLDGPRRGRVMVCELIEVAADRRRDGA